MKIFLLQVHPDEFGHTIARAAKAGMSRRS
jgi:hypothetical protein